MPDGYRLATMSEARNVAARAAVHRAAFDPSRVTEESYARVMAEWPYRPDLDFVVVAPDGSFASYALGWVDEANRTGLFEPVGRIQITGAVAWPAPPASLPCASCARPARRKRWSGVAGTPPTQSRACCTRRSASAS